ncbi:hypothetical protein ACFWGN_15155 [Oerskovia sp. NPDC060338]|uniref:hypothetical protein n=1 Tax=Oerskovia sp. NPDC060338 TaxID=3347100 RepID=UPI00365EDE33
MSATRAKSRGLSSWDPDAGPGEVKVTSRSTDPRFEALVEAASHLPAPVAVTFVAHLEHDGLRSQVQCGWGTFIVDLTVTGASAWPAGGGRGWKILDPIAPPAHHLAELVTQVAHVAPPPEAAPVNEQA